MIASAYGNPLPASAGIGLRLPHQAAVASGIFDAAWFEVHPENYTHDAAALAELRQVRTRRPLSLHAVGLSLGSAQGVDELHLARLRRLVDELQPALVSDHLSWSMAPDVYLADLLPLPYNDEALAVTCRNVTRVQEGLQRAILVENPSTYLQFADSPYGEAEFLAELVRRTGCGVLLDVNNIYVSASNQCADPAATLSGYLDAIVPGAIGEIHLAGHAVVTTDRGEFRIDDHGSRVSEAVWRLYEQTLARIGPRPTLIEWDTRLPEFGVLRSEAVAADLCLQAAGTSYARAG
jgi:uncharacterized protein (UPF0276 family)